MNLKTQQKFMKHCLNLAEKALALGNPPVGSILVYENRIIGEGIESGKSTGDITNHAEILTVRDAISKGNKALLKDAAMLSTHEPCIMCSYLIRHHKIPKIIFGTAVDFIGGCTSEFKVLETESVPKWEAKPTIIKGVLEDECLDLNRRFIELLNSK